MTRINEHFLKLTAGYLFPEIARRVNAFAAANPDARIIRLGIGDVTEPLPEACRTAMVRAVNEMGRRDTFHGYGPEQGYEFLREKIAQHDYQSRQCDVAPDEIFVSDGAKCDTGNILDIFHTGPDFRVAVTDPVYPVYVDTNVMRGNTGPANPQGEYDRLLYLPITEENDFTAQLPQTSQHVDLVYLCSPNNPTGTTMTKDHLKRWVQYAVEHEAIILYDAAYEAYITDSAVPHSIYEIDGARRCAIEFRSLSKNAGFTGVRCGFTVIPRDLTGKAPDGRPVAIHKLWSRRQSTKFNGVSYITQRGAEAVYSDQGAQQVRELVDFYMENARIIRQQLSDAGLRVFGGVNAPYVWVRTPDNLASWEFFDQLLNDAHIVVTPGSGFGSAGEGYIRISAFNSRENVTQAMQRLTAKVGK
jgi:LL-diaminopimelate aminotransferase